MKQESTTGCNFNNQGVKKRRKQKLDFVNVSFYSSSVSNTPKDRVFKMEYRQPANNPSPNPSNPSKKPSDPKNVPIFHWNIEKDHQPPNIPNQSPNSSSSQSSTSTKTTVTCKSSPKILKSSAELRESLQQLEERNYLELQNEKQVDCNEKSICNATRASAFRIIPRKIQRTRVFTISELLQQ